MVVAVEIQDVQTAKEEKYSESSCSVFERDALRKMVLLRWSVGAVGAGSAPSGAVGGARFGVLRLDKGRVPSRDYTKHDSNQA